MDLLRIKSVDHPLFPSFWELYEESFPRNERRSYDHQRTAFHSPHYYMGLYVEGDRVNGLLGYWEFDDYIYIEHLAVNPSLRGGGYGTRILAGLIDTTEKTLILEIEPVESEYTMKRFRFYERLGFKTNPYAHIQPLYHDDDPEGFMLMILTYPHPLSFEFYQRFYHDLKTLVMKK